MRWHAASAYRMYVSFRRAWVWVLVVWAVMFGQRLRSTNEIVAVLSSTSCSKRTQRPRYNAALWGAIDQHTCSQLRHRRVCTCCQALAPRRKTESATDKCMEAVFKVLLWRGWRITLPPAISTAQYARFSADRNSGAITRMGRNTGRNLHNNQQAEICQMWLAC